MEQKSLSRHNRNGVTVFVMTSLDRIGQSFGPLSALGGKTIFFYYRTLTKNSINQQLDFVPGLLKAFMSLSAEQSCPNQKAERN